MPAHKFGIELEVSGISPQTAAEALMNAGVEAVSESYNHRTRNYWKVTTDSSIQSTNGLACEVVSPILNFGNNNTIVTIRKVVEALINAGATVNESCGFHVHVNCRGTSNPDFFRLLLALYANHEDEIDRFVLSSRRENANRYCQTNKTLLENWERFWSSYVDPNFGSTRLINVFTDVPRYHKLNFNSYVRHGTVEFRQLQGTLDFDKIVAWIGFCVSLVDQTQRFLDSNVVPTNHVTLEPIRSISPKHYLLKTKGSYEGDINCLFADTHGYTRLNEIFGVTNSNMAKFISKGLFSKQEMNKIYLTMITAISHYADVHAQIVRDIANHNRTDDGFRELTFAYETKKQKEEMINSVTAIFFGFTGTESQITRKVNAKLSNVGISKRRDGSLILPRYALDYISEIANNTSRDAYDHRIERNLEGYEYLYSSTDEYKSERMFYMRDALKHFAAVGNAYNSSNPRTTNHIRNNRHIDNPTNLTNEILKLAFLMRAYVYAWQSEGNRERMRNAYALSHEREYRNFRMNSSNILSSIIDGYTTHNPMYRSVITNDIRYVPVEKTFYLDAAKKIRSESNDAFALMEACAENQDNHPPQNPPQARPAPRAAAPRPAPQRPRPSMQTAREVPMPTPETDWYVSIDDAPMADGVPTPSDDMPRQRSHPVNQTVTLPLQRAAQAAATTYGNLYQTYTMDGSTFGSGLSSIGRGVSIAGNSNWTTSSSRPVEWRMTYQRTDSASNDDE